MAIRALSIALLLGMGAATVGCSSQRSYLPTHDDATAVYPVAPYRLSAVRPPSKRLRPAARVVRRQEGRVVDPVIVAPPLHARTPVVGSPEWQREQAYSEQREREIHRAVYGICSACFARPPELPTGSVRP